MDHQMRRAWFLLRRGIRDLADPELARNTFRQRQGAGGLRPSHHRPSPIVLQQGLYGQAHPLRLDPSRI